MLAYPSYEKSGSAMVNDCAAICVAAAAGTVLPVAPVVPSSYQDASPSASLSTYSAQVRPDGGGGEQTTPGSGRAGGGAGTPDLAASAPAAAAGAPAAEPPSPESEAARPGGAVTQIDRELRSARGGALNFETFDEAPDPAASAPAAAAGAPEAEPPSPESATARPGGAVAQEDWGCLCSTGGGAVETFGVAPGPDASAPAAPAGAPATEAPSPESLHSTEVHVLHGLTPTVT